MLLATLARFRLLLLVELLLFSTCLNVWSYDIRLAWDANSETNLAGYKIYQGEESGVYDFVHDIPLDLPGFDPVNPEMPILGLLEDKTYYFAATAYDTDDNESGYSSEVSKFKSSGNPPAPATAGQIAFVWIEEPVSEGLQMGKDYELTILPDGSVLYILPDADPSGIFGWGI